jgi:dihydrodipicolinate synthase/N-acetylneuraminate lyase
MDQPYRGVYAILLTTYDDQDQVDQGDLVSQADFVASTAQGIVWPVLASEFFLLDDDEKKAGFTAVSAGNRGRVPFVAGVTSPTTRAGVALAEAAAEAGAAAVITMAPYFKKASGAELVKHFQAIATVGLPIFIQNSSWLGGASTLGIAELKTVADEIPEVQYVKEEAPVLPETITRLLKALPGTFKGVFGGGGARFLIDELNWGGAGNMPACQFADVFGYAVDRYDRGERAEARRWHAAGVIGYNNVEAAYPGVGPREVLRRRGVLRSTRSRYSPTGPLDAAASAEIDATLEFLAPHLRWPDHKLNP